MLNCVRYLCVDADNLRRYRTWKNWKFKGKAELLTYGKDNVVRILEMGDIVLFWDSLNYSL
jgi:hypothetical protein